MKNIILLISLWVISLTVTAEQATEPCGPSGQLSASLANNVAADARCFELRMYTVLPDENGEHGIDELHQRFREQEITIFERLGAEIIAVWQRLDNPNTLVWMLAYKDRAHRDQVWSDFIKDPEWLALYEKYPAKVSPEVYMMSNTDYSPMK
jgi:hypothetical protein